MTDKKFPNDFVPAPPRQDKGALTDSEIVAMAWCDFTSFDSIERQSGLTESDVIALMRRHMTPKSFRMWRKRASGRAAKHDAKINSNQS